ncbi:flagellar filament capping protein FliD [Candidatus Binatia bacterium]|nr:flagellar filament capping protein FliD [Candidatus Binatia bacterium]
MATITIGGLATGLDTNTIVSQLVSLERKRAVDLLQIDQLDQQAKQSALATFGTKLADLLAAVDKLRDPSSALARTATSSDPDTIGATAGSGALVGTTEITVSQLARNAVAVSGTGVASSTSTIASGSGTFAFKIGSGSTQSIAIDATTTLDDLATKINALGVGANATVVNLGTDASPDYRLRLASRDTGLSNDLTIVTDDTNLGVTVTQAARNATFTVSGFATSFSRENNVVNDVVSGVTLTLNQEGGPVKIGVTTDAAAVTKDVQAVVTAYNALASFVDAQSEVTQDGNSTDRDVTTGPLAFDSTVRSIMDGLRSAVSSSVSGLTGSYSLLAETGLTSTKDGTLSLDAAKLAAALADDEAGVSQLFGGLGSAGGAFDRIHDYLTDVTGSTGLLATRNKSITDALSSLNERIAAGERTVAAFEENLRSQFSSLEVLVNNLKAQGSMISSALGRTA